MEGKCLDWYTQYGPGSPKCLRTGEVDSLVTAWPVRPGASAAPNWHWRNRTFLECQRLQSTLNCDEAEIWCQQRNTAVAAAREWRLHLWDVKTVRLKPSLPHFPLCPLFSGCHSKDQSFWAGLPSLNNLTKKTPFRCAWWLYLLVNSRSSQADSQGQPSEVPLLQFHRHFCTSLMVRLGRKQYSIVLLHLLFAPSLFSVCLLVEHRSCFQKSVILLHYNKGRGPRLPCFSLRSASANRGLQFQVWLHWHVASICLLKRNGREQERWFGA